MMVSKLQRKYAYIHLLTAYHNLCKWNANESAANSENQPLVQLSETGFQEPKSNFYLRICKCKKHCKGPVLASWQAVDASVFSSRNILLLIGGYFAKTGRSFSILAKKPRS